LTPEEKEAKLKEIRAKIAERKLQKQREEEEAELLREKNRREQGQKVRIFDFLPLCNHLEITEFYSIFSIPVSFFSYFSSLDIFPSRLRRRSKSIRSVRSSDFSNPMENLLRNTV
jgi:hypothetical protein